MFFFKLDSEEEFSKDCFMKQKPFNDNLVMASIESLYEQASHTVRPNTDGLRRHNLRDLPIIGSLPVQIGQQEGTCLLYTSPSPRDNRVSRMPSSA